MRRRLFDLNVSAAREKNADARADRIEDSIERALMEVRAERFKKPV